jgi:hypothetical protein
MVTVHLSLDFLLDRWPQFWRLLDDRRTTLLFNRAFTTRNFITELRSTGHW